MRYCGIHLRIISQQLPKLLFCIMSLKIILLNLLPHLPMAKELMWIFTLGCYHLLSVLISTFWGHLQCIVHLSYVNDWLLLMDLTHSPKVHNGTQRVLNKIMIDIGEIWEAKRSSTCSLDATNGRRWKLWFIPTDSQRGSASHPHPAFHNAITRSYSHVFSVILILNVAICNL